MTNPLFSQVEEQYKYSIDAPNEMLQFIVSSENADSLLFYFHTKSTYFDLYLDTPENLMYKNKLSLRLRKRVFDSLNYTSYTFQLKSEMNSDDRFRMEVEESELDFYLIKSDTGWTSMTSLLDTIFNRLERGPTGQDFKQQKESIALIEKWIQFKADGAIAPFQELLHLGIELNEIKKLKPVIYINSTRYRSHVYTEQTNSTFLGTNKIKRDKTPPFFLENPENIWLLETSFDQSSFTNLLDTSYTAFEIEEFEVENKYYQPEKGTRIISALEQFLIENFNAVSKLDSKYRQAVILLK